MITLTKRQMQIHDYLVNSPLQRKEIADKLFITAGTIADHTNKIMNKLGVFSRVEMMYRYHVLQEHPQHE